MYDICLCIDNNSAESGNQGEENPLTRIEQTTGLFKTASAKHPKHPKTQEVLTWQRNSAAF